VPRSKRNPQSDKKTKQLKQKFAPKTATEKSSTKQKQITGREPELTHLFKNNSFDISLYREFLYTSHAGFFSMWEISLKHPFFFFFF